MIVASIDPAIPISGVSALAALAAALFAYRSSRLAARYNVIVEQQEARRTPRIIPYLSDAYVRRLPETRLFATLLTITNPSDTDNAITRIELQVVYRLMSGIIMTVRIPHNPGLGGGLALSDTHPFTPPVRLVAHDAVVGWGFFELPVGLLEGGEIDGYQVRFTDAHGLWVEQQLGLLRDVLDEATT